jgi:hypothetical protein
MNALTYPQENTIANDLERLVGMSSTTGFRADKLTAPPLGVWHEGIRMIDGVKQRMVTKSEPDLHPADTIHYELRFTRDRRLIAKYKQLRRKLYDIDPRFVGFRIFSDDEAENYEDADDQMLILHDGDTCYGGACLRVSTPQRPVILDLEQDILPEPGKFYFSLRERFPELGLDKYAYGEFNRVVLDPRLRKGDALRKIFQAVLDRCLEHRVRYLLSISDVARGRLYRQIYRNAGMDCFIRKDTDIPMRREYEGMKMYLLHGDMKPFYTVAADPEGISLLNPIDHFEFY